MASLRESTLADAERIKQIYNQSIAARDSTMDQHPKPPQAIRSWIEDLGEREVMLVLQVQETVVGWGILKRYSERPGYRFTGETSVYLDRDYVGERRGFGSQLQEALIERARSYDYHHLVAKVWADNAISRALHRKFGYELVGVQREVGYVDGRWQHVAILQLLL